VLRARAARHDFALDAGNAQTVARICTRLDGLPLALELAAARVPALPPATLLARLEEPLRLLTDGARDAPARQRTLRETIAWSYGLLSPVEQALFRRLSVFAGGATLAAIEAICRLDEEPEDLPGSAAVVEGLSTLVRQSLLQVEEPSGEVPAGEPRYTMLETIREYGREQLIVAGEVETLRAQHAVHYLSWVEQEAGPLSFCPDQVIWLQRLDEETDNLRVALGWCLERGQAGDLRAMEDGLLSASCLGGFWHVRGREVEARTWLEGLLALSPDKAMTRGRGNALSNAALFACYMGDLTQAYAMAEEGLTIQRQVGTVLDQVLTLDYVAFLKMTVPRPCTSDLTDALALLEEALVLLSGIDKPDAYVLDLTSLCDINMGSVLNALGDVTRAKAHLDRVVAMERGPEAHHALEQALMNRAMLAQGEGDLQAADAYLERALWHAGVIGFQPDIGEVFAVRGDVAQQAGDLGAARRWYTQAAQVFEPTGCPEPAMLAWCGLAEVRLASGEVESALRLVAAAMALTRAAGAHLRAQTQERLDRVQARAEALLGAAASAAAWAAGQVMSPGEIVAEAVRTAGVSGPGSGDGSGG
jgi:tetratricopeptide (TPR) repeat protein